MEFLLFYIFVVLKWVASSTLREHYFIVYYAEF